MALPRYWLSRRILLPVSGATLLLLTGVLLLFVLLIRQEADRELQQGLEAAGNYWATDLEHHASKLEGALVTLTTTDGLADALAARDRPALAERLAPLWRQYRRLHGFDRLLLLDLEGRVVFRLHAPERYGDRIDPRGESGAEVVVTPQGLDLLLMQPLYQNESRVGYIALGESLSHLLRHLDTLFGLHHTVLVAEEKLPEKWKEAVADNVRRWQRVAWAPNHLTLQDERDGDPPAEAEQLLQERGASAFSSGEIVRCKGGHCFLGALPIGKGTGEALGHLLIWRNVTAARTSLQRTVLAVILLAVAVTFVLLGFLWHVSRRVEEEYQVLFSRVEAGRSNWEEAFDAIREPIFLHDQAFRIVRANRSYAQLAGLPFRAFIGRPYWEAFPKGSGPLPHCAAALEGSIDLEAGQEEEEEFETDDGRNFLSRAFYTTREDGSFRYSVHILEEMTEQYRLLQQVQESEARYRLLFTNMFDGFALHEILLDETGRPHDYRFLDVNPVFERLTGLKREAIIGRTVKEVMPEVEPTWIERYGRVALTGEPTHFTMESGPLGRTFEVTAFRPEPGQFAVLFQDLSELKRENRMRRILSASNQALIKSDNEKRLLETICRIITAEAGYPLVWIGLRAEAEEGEGEELRPVAVSGLPREEWHHLPTALSEPVGEEHPAARALRTGRRVLLPDATAAAICRACRRLAKRLGYGSVLALPLLRGGTPFGTLTIAAGRAESFNATEMGLLEELADDLAFGLTALRTAQQHREGEQEREQLLQQLKTNLDKTVQAMARALEARDPYTAGHQERVAKLATAMAREMELPTEQVEVVRIAASIHDLGKINIPAEILSKPGRLSPTEFELIKSHAQVGYELLKDIEFPWPIARIVRQHHERLDGSGYPDGAHGEAILPEAAILAVADVVEAMASHRPYRPALPLEQALAEIEEYAGIRYDPEAAKACLRLFRERGFAW